ncbi:MAG: aldose 1-epimerase [Acidobacteriota bacterium]|nr:aldose 1-epimerase [Acidobacteriota bacterium]
MRRFLILLALPVITLAATRYTAEKTTDHGVEVVHLMDAQGGVEVSIVPSVGNRAYELKVHGKNLLYFPPSDIAAFKNSARPSFSGIPFLAPWANRIAGGGFWANGKRYLFNSDLGSVHVGSDGIAMHGMLTASPLWEVTDVKADEKSAHVTSRLAFWKYPELMANWPFAHEYEMTYSLADGILQVITTVRNVGAEPMPIVLGYHPYFNIPDVPRAESTVHLAARKHVETDAHLVATGELTPNTLPDQVSLKDHTFDDGFTDLVRGKDGRAIFSVQAGRKKIEVIYGPKYQVAVVYAPPAQNYVCFEPMAAITDGINLAHDGKYPGLEMVAPGASWQESFWVRFSGF